MIFLTSIVQEQPEHTKRLLFVPRLERRPDSAGRGKRGHRAVAGVHISTHTPTHTHMYIYRGSLRERGTRTAPAAVEHAARAAPWPSGAFFRLLLLLRACVAALQRAPQGLQVLTDHVIFFFDLGFIALAALARACMQQHF